MRRSGIVAVLITAAIAVAPHAAHARGWQVKMLDRDKGGMMAFEPAFIAVKPGDSITFVPIGKGYNAESVPEMLPTGAAPFKGRTDERITVKFTTPGLYGYKCLAHASMGMVGLVQVGPATNKNQAQAGASRLPALGKERMGELIAQAR